MIQENIDNIYQANKEKAFNISRYKQCQLKPLSKL